MSGPQHKHAKPYLEGRDIERYGMNPTGNYIRYLPDEMYSPRTPELFESKKIVSQSMLSRMRLVATLDSAGYYVEQSLVCIVPHGVVTDPSEVSEKIPLEFILGALNSRIGSFYFATQIIDFSLGGGLIHATPGAQERLLVPKAAPARVTTQVVNLVKQMLALLKERGGSTGPQGEVSLERQIEATSSQIDRSMYELYGLTEHEIALVESSDSR